MNIQAISNSLIVLIVPLWNWNIETATELFTQGGFNRTFMELKFVVAFGYRG